MDSLARVVILMSTAIALIYIFSHQPQPAPLRVEAVVLPYCEIDFPSAYKNRHGKWEFGFGHSWGPCSLMDRYEEI